MRKANLGCLTERHLLLFGTIVQYFARYELLIQEIMATVAGCDAASVMLMTRSLDFNGKRLALLELLRHKTIPADRYDRITAYLARPRTFTPLRNDIVHSAWIPGEASNSIQPNWILRIPASVRPLRGEGIIEREDEKIGYSVEDLEEAVDVLVTNYESFSIYLHEVGMIRRNPATP
jgi:hypothetical protein